MRRKGRVSDLRVLAVASGGGHWVQLRRALPAFADMAVVCVTVDPAYGREIEHPVRVVRDATRWDRWGVFVLAGQVLRILWRERPDLVVTTGAAPGLWAVLLGRLLGARTIWLDSVANVEELSMSGRIAGRFVHLWLTQWPELAREGGPEYAGAVFCSS